MWYYNNVKRGYTPSLIIKKKFQKTFEKPLDKQYQICYNNYRKKEKRGNKYGCFNEIRVWFEVYWFGF